MAASKIRVLVVDDSLFVRRFICDAIEKDPNLEVVGTASDPYDARDKIIELAPDVMTLDVEMPRMNGIEFLRQLMPQYPLPVLVVSSVSDAVFDALEAGAVDFVNKTNLSDAAGRDAFAQELVVKIKIASIAKVGQHKKAMPTTTGKVIGGLNRRIIALGASTGGTEATYSIMKDLQRDLPGMVIVQHMPPVFTRMYAERLNNTCPMEVKEAENGDEIRPGRALVAPGEYQLEVQKQGTKYVVRVYKGEKVSGHCPSVDVLFQSVAKVYGKDAIGVLLTGMGADGAKGLLEMYKTGATTIGQDKETSVVYGMPQAAKNLGGVTKELPLGQIARGIYQWQGTYK
ncbi:chemotaxis response regulator protein-glutamate methylesterase [Eubacteriales bacterium OttesenSCG-928-M02]|nr:chemotaxis response regulator protein-glutamate methylesterase [Eubacteriales bacterium OttesenSCG-928-M02]